MKEQINECTLWRTEQYQAEFASYSLTHHSFPRHFHEYFVIELVVKGADRFYCNGKNYEAHPGSLVFINPGEVHTGSTIDNKQLQYFSFYPALGTLETIAEALEIRLPSSFHFQETLSKMPELATKFLTVFHSLRSGKAKLKQEESFLSFMSLLLKSNSCGNTDNYASDLK